MQTIDLISSYSHVGDVASIFICVLLLILISTSVVDAGDFSYAIFVQSIVFVMIAAVANIGFSLAVTYTPDKRWLIFLTRDIYHFLLMATLCAYTAYLRNLLALEGDANKRATTIPVVVFVVGILFDVLSPFTHLGFYYDRVNGVWSDSTYIKPYTFSYIAFFLIFAYMLIKHYSRMINQIRSILVMVEIISVSLIIVENTQDSNTYTTLTFLFPIIAVLVLLHSTPFDLVSGALGLDSLEKYLSKMSKKDAKMSYMVLRLYTEGETETPPELGRELYYFWKTYLKKVILFKPFANLYVLAIENDNEKNVNVLTSVKTMVYEEFPKYYERYRIDYHIVILPDVRGVFTAKKLMEQIEFYEESMAHNEVLFADEKMEKSMRKRQCIVEQLADIARTKNLDDPRVMVFCQPVKNVRTGYFDTAEALMRLNLPDIGLVFPDEFIPLAERYGYVHVLSLIILNKTCKYISKTIANGFALERISVNVSTLELRENNFCEDIIGVLAANRVPSGKIAIELTESQNDEDFDLIMEKVNALKKEGIYFYLDDFGTGYSNLDRILKLELNTIKFDRSLLLYVDDEPNNRFLLKYFAEIFHKLNYKILFEGVETAEHEFLCSQCNADYLQGYRYSRPVAITELTNFLRKTTDY